MKRGRVAVKAMEEVMTHSVTTYPLPIKSCASKPPALILRQARGQKKKNLFWDSGDSGFKPVLTWTVCEIGLKSVRLSELQSLLCKRRQRNYVIKTFPRSPWVVLSHVRPPVVCLDHLCTRCWDTSRWDHSWLGGKGRSFYKTRGFCKSSSLKGSECLVLF